MLIRCPGFAEIGTVPHSRAPRACPIILKFINSIGHTTCVEGVPVLTTLWYGSGTFFAAILLQIEGKIDMQRLLGKR